MNIDLKRSMFFKTKLFLIILLFASLECTNNDPDIPKDKLQLISVKIGQVFLSPDEEKEVRDVSDIVATFVKPLEQSSINLVELLNETSGSNIALDVSLADNDKLLLISPKQSLEKGESYSLILKEGIVSKEGELFDGQIFLFSVEKEALRILSLKEGGNELDESQLNMDIAVEPAFELEMSSDIDAELLNSEIYLVGKANYDFNVEKVAPAKYLIQSQDKLGDFEKLALYFPESLGTKTGFPFVPVNYQLFTVLDSTPDFPLIPDEDLLTLVQKQTFKYFWDFGHPNSGMARERNSSGNTITSGGSGFGLMAMIVAVERDFISRVDAVKRWQKIVDFLANADRFHGAWAHWMNGNTGSVIPFSSKDDGGDLVETAFLVQGLLTVRQYLDDQNAEEKKLIEDINSLWESVEWDWYTRGGQDRLFWHWSPQYGWDMNMQIGGHNETQITYILAAASPTHSIEKEVYVNGYARNGAMQNGNSYYGFKLPLGWGKGGPLFFTHYSYLGMDPRNLQDDYASYWEQNTSHTMINRAYCIDNPNHFPAYSQDCWGLTASDNHQGYSAHSPSNDLGVITPTAALSSMPYAPSECMDALRFFYYQLGDKLWGPYGFYDAFNIKEGWIASSYLAIDQGPIICMIENHRSALLWDLFMSAPEIQEGLNKLGFTY